MKRHETSQAPKCRQASAKNVCLGVFGPMSTLFSLSCVPYSCLMSSLWCGLDVYLPVLCNMQLNVWNDLAKAKRRWKKNGLLVWCVVPLLIYAEVKRQRANAGRALRRASIP